MSIYRKILGLLTRSEKKSAFTLLLLMLVGMGFETLGVGLVVPVIGMLVQDDFLKRFGLLNHEIFSIQLNKAELIMSVMLMLAIIYFFKNIFLGFLAWRQARFSFDIQKQLSQRLFTLYLYQPYTFHLKRNSAQLINNVTTETNLFCLSVSAFLMIFTECLVVIGVLVLLMIVEPLGAFTAITMLVLASYFFLRVTKTQVKKLASARQFHESMRLQQLQQGLGGVKEINLYNREHFFLSKYSTHNIQSANAAEFQNVMLQVPRLWLEFLAVVGLVVLVAVMLRSNKEISQILPTIGLFAAAAFRLLPSANRILNSIQTVRYGIPSVGVLSNEAELAEKAVASEQKHDLYEINHIEINHVTYAYPDTSQPVLNDICFKINRGESIGLIGGSGSGKSTLVDIIMGLINPDAGKILVNEKDILFNLTSWQRQIGYVPQSIFLTDDTLRENIAFGISGDAIDAAAVSRSIKAAQLEEFISSLPAGLDTIVGERGIRLSGGQRQRIGIARALYHDPDVLVLDEATSALDHETERNLMQAINALHGSKTLIIVAHRLSTIEKCDRVYGFTDEGLSILSPEFSIEQIEKKSST